MDRPPSLDDWVPGSDPERRRGANPSFRQGLPESSATDGKTVEVRIIIPPHGTIRAFEFPSLPRPLPQGEGVKCADYSVWQYRSLNRATWNFRDLYTWL